MAADNFEACLAEVLTSEGGFVHHPSDPGGATNMGITHATLASWRGLKLQDLPIQEVKNIDLAEVRAIYRALYWDKVQGDKLPIGIDMAIFDFAVNSGVSRATKFSQDIVGTSQDGVLGPKTLSALKNISSTAFVNELCAARMRFLKNLSTFPTFGKGWSRRVEKVLAIAKNMIAEQEAKGGNNIMVTPSFFAGYKTYMVAVIMFIVGLAQLGGFDLSVLGEYSGTQLLFEAFALIFLRKSFDTLSNKA